MSDNGTPDALLEALREGLVQQDALPPSYLPPELPEPPAMFSAEWFTVQVIAQTGVVNQRMAAFTATQEFQLYQQEVGKLELLKQQQAALP